MRKVFTASHPAEAHLVRGWLVNEGVDATVAGEELFQTRGRAPVTPDTLPTVWVVNDADERRALDLLASANAPLPASDSPQMAAASWRCPKCGELVEPEFTACWNCGTERPDLA